MTEFRKNLLTLNSNTNLRISRHLALITHDATMSVNCLCDRNKTSVLSGIRAEMLLSYNWTDKGKTESICLLYTNSSDLFQFKYFSSRRKHFPCLVSSVFFYLCSIFRAFSCLNNLTNIFETLHHDGQNKETITTEKAERVLTCNSLLCFEEYREPKGIIVLAI